MGDGALNTVFFWGLKIPSVHKPVVNTILALNRPFLLFKKLIMRSGLTLLLVAAIGAFNTPVTFRRPFDDTSVGRAGDRRLPTALSDGKSNVSRARVLGIGWTKV